MMKRKAISFGEALLDTYPLEHKASVGGAPLNVAITLAQDGIESYLLTCLGTDTNSDKVKETLLKNGVKTNLLQVDSKRKLAYTEVAVDEHGDRSFTFFKDAASFLGIQYQDSWKDEFKELSLFHMGTVCLLDDTIINTQLKACKLAVSNEAMISLDPNFRAQLFKSEAQVRNSLTLLPYVDILKLSEEEIGFFKMSTAEFFMRFKKLKAIFLSQGDKGITLYLADGREIKQEAIKPRKIVDTVGCGDISFATFLAVILLNNISLNDTASLKTALLYSAAAGSLECERESALPVPTLVDIKDRLKQLN